MMFGEKEMEMRKHKRGKRKFRETNEDFVKVCMEEVSEKGRENEKRKGQRRRVQDEKGKRVRETELHIIQKNESAG